MNNEDSTAETSQRRCLYSQYVYNKKNVSNLSLGVLAQNLQLGRAETQQMTFELHLGNLSRRADGLQAQCLLLVKEQQDAHLI